MKSTCKTCVPPYLAFLVLTYLCLLLLATPLRDLENQLKILRRNCNVSSSWATNPNSQWRQFKNFCDMYALRSLPATVKTVPLFVAHLAKSHEYTTAINCAASIVPYHHHHNVDALNIVHFSIKQAVAGVQRNREELPNRRRPASYKNVTRNPRQLTDLTCQTSQTILDRVYRRFLFAATLSQYV